MTRDVGARTTRRAGDRQRFLLCWLVGLREPRRDFDARRPGLHWKIFSDTFTDPDPEFRPLLEEARVALNSAGMPVRTLAP